MPAQQKYSQASTRSYRVFTDQHGRKWGADVENKTQAPCGPLALLTRPPLAAVPPVMPPTKYIRLADAASGELRIDYGRWLSDLDTAWEEFELFALEQATDLYGDAAPEKLQNPTPALRRRLGRDRPLRREVVIAMREGNEWILGLSTERPKWADRFLQVEEKADETAFLHEEAADDVDEDDAEKNLPDGLRRYRTLLRQADEMGLLDELGPKPKADELEKAIAEAGATPAAVGGGIDDSWKE